MSYPYTFEEAINLARSNTDDRPLHDLLGRLIVSNRSPRNANEINTIRDRAWDDIVRKFYAGQETESIAKQLRDVVKGAIIDEDRHNAARPVTESLDAMEPVEVRKNTPTSASAESDFLQNDACDKVMAALLAFENSDELSDRRYFVAIVARLRGRSVVDALRDRFGEELTSDAAKQLVRRGRAKLRNIIKASGSKRAS